MRTLTEWTPLLVANVLEWEGENNEAMDDAGLTYGVEDSTFAYREEEIECVVDNFADYREPLASLKRNHDIAHSNLRRARFDFGEVSDEYCMTYCSAKSWTGEELPSFHPVYLEYLRYDVARQDVENLSQYLTEEECNSCAQ